MFSLVINQSLANIAVILATISTVAFLLPQIVKLVRSGDSDGVSTTWPALGFVINAGWCIYLIAQALWVAVFAPFFTFLAYGVTMWALLRTGRDLSTSYLRGVVATTLLTAVAIIGGWEVLGVFLGISYGVVITPSIWTAYRTSIPSGISALTWWIGLVEALLWGYYGWFHSDRGIVTFMVVGVIGSGLMLIRFYTTRSRSTPAPLVAS
ncbi:MAG: PQ-loop domain-containing transporter [Acidimicrobiia bacterium]